MIRVHANRLRLGALLVACSLALLLGGCSEPRVTPLDPQPDNPFKSYAIGTDTTLEIVTWNLLNFATTAQEQEVALAAQVVEGLAADVVAVQEIAQWPRFAELVATLPDYAGHQARSNSYQNLGYLWNEADVEVQAIYEIYVTSDYSLPFPRRPLVMEMTWRDREFVIVNNHLKAMDSGSLDRDDPRDNGNRRWVACQLLDAWIDSEHPDKAVIVLGDMNDVLTIPPPNNVFEPFYLRPDRYRFADQAVAEGPSTGWSYPSWPSHIDHILVTSQLFAALDATGANCLTVRVDHALLSGEYRRQLSDHLPVALIMPQSALHW